MSSDSSNLIVNYLPPSFREIELQTLFSPYGEIIHTKVVFRKDTAESLTYGFVKFEKNEDASAALNALNGLEICGKKIKVSYARPSDPEIKNSKIFITRLPKSYTADDIRELFQECGEIIESRLLVDNDGNSRQLAFIQFSNHTEAELAIKNFSGTVPPKGDQSLVIKYAIQPKALPPSISSHHSSEDFDQYSNSSQENIYASSPPQQQQQMIPQPAPAAISSMNQMKNQRNNRQQSHSRHSSHPHSMMHPQSSISTSSSLQWSSQNIPSPYWPPPPSHTRYDQYIPQQPPPSPSYQLGHQIQQSEHYQSSPNPNSQHPHHSNYMHPLHYNSHPHPHSHQHPPPPAVAAPAPLPPPTSTPISTNIANISTTSPAVIGIIISPIPHSVDVLSFPFLRDYGVIIEGKLEPLSQSPQNLQSSSNQLIQQYQSQTSSIDSHSRSNMSSSSPSHPSFTPHRLVYQMRVDSPERAQSLVRFHGTTLQLNGYFMTLEIQSL